MPNIDGLNNQNQHYDSYTRTILRQRGGQKPRKRRFWKWLILALLLLIGAAFVFGGNLLGRFNSIFTNKESVFTRVGKLFVSEDTPLQGEETGRVNILLLGMGGPGHEGPLLTDTIIVASVEVTTGEVTLISVPRDYMVAYSGRAYNKINAAYAFAEQNEENTGGQASIEKVEQITGLDIPYFMAVDFKGFVKAVDTVGGIDLTVDTTFTDSQYPNYNNGYLPPQTFTAGPAHMDGETALIFARSRHGNNGEGSDFARSERQKKVMLAMKDKLQGLDVTNLSTLNGLLSDFTENFRTNMEPHELLRLSSFGPKIQHDSVYSLSLDPDGVTICQGIFDLGTGRPAPPRPTAVPVTDSADDEAGGADAESSEDGSEQAETGDGTEDAPAATPTTPVDDGIIRAYVVVPCAGKDASDVNEYLATAMQTASLQKEEPVIEIQNSTGKAAATGKIRALLQSDVETKTAAFRGGTAYEKTVLYDNTAGAKPNTLKYLQDSYGLDKSDVPFPSSTADFVIVLGNDALQ